MNYEKIDVCERNCMLFWKEHKDDTECMHCGRSRYVKVVNEDGAFVILSCFVVALYLYVCSPVQKIAYCLRFKLFLC
jgi:hypothetical protein